MKKDLPFLVAFILALLLHFAAGAGLKYSRLLAASPVPPPAPNAPVTLRFVEVPPDATTVPERMPDAKHFSDANRKAGPKEAGSPKRPVVQQPLTRPPGPGRERPASPTGPVPAQPTTRQPSRPQQPGEEPRIAASPDGQLSDSLQNLDRYIRSGTPGGGGGQGNLPTGDPGSGVFFDTQGYDLGPWANRTVEIVRSNWIIPVAAELGLKGVVGISFQIDRSGNILNLKMVSTSGIPSFDQAALNALQSSSPLPPLPADFPREILPGVFRFYYNTPVPEP